MADSITSNKGSDANARAILARTLVDHHPLVGDSGPFTPVVRNWIYVGVLGDLLRDPETDIEVAIETYVDAYLGSHG
jgi:hypothetical protein